LTVLRPAKFELVANLRAAKVFQLDAPDTLLAIANDVID
jgi:hypothetical protein